MSLTERARAEAEMRCTTTGSPEAKIWSTRQMHDFGVAMAEWAVRQEPTDAEVAALIDSLAQQADVFIMPLTASMALQDARAARRDEEK